MRPLEGKSVLVTRPEGQATEFASKLAELGAIPIFLPGVRIAPLEDSAMLDSSVRSLEMYDWVVLTSVNGVAAVRQRMESLGVPPSHLAERQLAAIGPATASALAAFCRAPDLVPDEYVSEAIASAIPEVEGQRFLLARADLARKDLAAILRARGADVTEVAAYRIEEAGGPVTEAIAPDYVALTSSAGAAAILDRFEQAGVETKLRAAAIVCIGPVTAKTVLDRGYTVARTAAKYTSDGLIEAILALAAQEVSVA